jgi:hypothetical protein
MKQRALGSTCFFYDLVQAAALKAVPVELFEGGLKDPVSRIFRSFG